MIRLISIIIVLFAVTNVYSSVTLPYTNNYDSCAEWIGADGQPDCNGLSEKFLGKLIDGDKGTQITSNAGYGGSGKGQRMWIYNGNQVQTSPLELDFDQAYSVINIRWYMRYEANFPVGVVGTDDNYQKLLYFKNNNADSAYALGPTVVIRSRNWANGGQLIFSHTEDPGSTYQTGGWGSQFYTSGPSTGEWVLMELQMDTVNKTVKWWVNETLVMNATGITYRGQFTGLHIQSNHRHYIGMSRPMYLDYDNIKITADGNYIGPVGSTPTYITCYPDVDGDLYPGAGSETVETCSTDYYVSSHFISMDEDCDDTDEAFNHDAKQVCGNSRDEQTCAVIDDDCSILSTAVYKSSNGAIYASPHGKVFRRAE